MSRRPRRNRPPRLDLLPPPGPGAPTPGAERRPSVPTLRRALLQARITGSHARLGRDAVRQSMRALVAGHPHARLGCDDLAHCTTDEVRAALAKTHGFDLDDPRATIAPDATLAALRSAAVRVRDAAAAGARVAVATSRPASLLGLAQWVAGEAAAGGADVRTATRAAIGRSRSRELWWVGDVAVVTDGRALLATDAVAAGDDWLFAVGRPDLVVADRGFAGMALRAGLDVVAWADLDAPGLSVAAVRGRSILVVPLDEQQPASAYDAAIAVLAASAPSAPLAPSGPGSGGPPGSP